MIPKATTTTPDPELSTPLDPGNQNEAKPTPPGQPESTRPGEADGSQKKPRGDEAQMDPLCDKDGGVQLKP